MNVQHEVVGVGEFDSHPDQSFIADLKKQMKEFSCCRSSTIQSFITTDKIYNGENHGESRSYVICDSNRRLNGFFTLGITAIEWNTVEKSSAWKALSRKKKKHLGNYLRTNAGYIGIYTIGELARKDGVKSEDLPGKVILMFALRSILKASKIAGGRFVLVDSRRTVFDSLYHEAGFMEVGTKESPNKGEDEQFIISLLPLENVVGLLQDRIDRQ